MKTAILLFWSFILLHVSYSLHAQTFYGADKLKNKPHTRSPYYIQVGSFKNRPNAERVKKQYLGNGFPIRIVPHGAMSAVIIGPISNSTPHPEHKVQNLQQSLKESKKTRPLAAVRPTLMQKPIHSSKRVSTIVSVGSLKDNDFVQNAQWYLQVEGGALFSNLSPSMTVDNGSTYPYHLDTYTVATTIKARSSSMQEKRIQVIAITSPVMRWDYVINTFFLMITKGLLPSIRCQNF